MPTPSHGSEEIRGNPEDCRGTLAYEGRICNAFAALNRWAAGLVWIRP